MPWIHPPEWCPLEMPSVSTFHRKSIIYHNQLAFFKISICLLELLRSFCPLLTWPEKGAKLPSKARVKWWHFGWIPNLDELRPQKMRYKIAPDLHVDFLRENANIIVLKIHTQYHKSNLLGHFSKLFLRSWIAWPSWLRRTLLEEVELKRTLLQLKAKPDHRQPRQLSRN